MSTCDPFGQIDALLAKIDEIRKEGAGVLAGLAGGIAFPSPASLQSMLECLVTGTADRTAGDVYPSGYNPYDLEAFKRQTKLIYDSVALSAQEDRNRISRDLLHSNDAALATSGIWLSGDAANTFHGLVIARSRRIRQDVADMHAHLEQAGTLLEDLDASIGDIPPGAADLLAAARSLMETTCPELVGIAGEFRQIGADVGASGDLGRSTCGATSLQERLRALVDGLPQQAKQAVARCLEILRQLQAAVGRVDTSIEKVNAGVTLIPAFDAQIEAGSHLSISEQAIHEQVAAQLEALCAEIQALVNGRRYGDMQRVVPRIHATAAIALDILASDGNRVNAVRTHAASLPYQMYVDRLSLIGKVEKLTDRMDDIQGQVFLAVMGANNRVRERIAELVDAVGAVESFRSDVERAADDYSEAVVGLVDELCVGILTRLLAMTGYQQIEDMFLNGLFGEIPRLLQESAATISQLVRCLQEFTAGACKSLPQDGPQIFALDRLSEVTRAAERVQDFVSEAGARIQGARDSMTGTLDRLAGAIQKDVRAAIGAPPASVPADSPIARLTAPRSGKRSGFDCARGVTTTADGFMKGDNPFGLPEGVSRDSNGYLVHDGVAPLPAGTYRDGGGFLKKLPDSATGLDHGLRQIKVPTTPFGTYTPRII